MAKYLDHRDKIESGDLLAWSHRGIKSFYDFKIWLIRLFTQSEYTHVGVAWVVGGRVFVIEAVTPYVRIVPLSSLLPAYVVNVNAMWNDSAEEFALSLVGKAEYSQLEAIKAYFGLNKNPSMWQCVEFYKAVLAFTNLYFTGRDVPSDLVLEAQKIGSTTYLE